MNATLLLLAMTLAAAEDAPAPEEAPPTPWESRVDEHGMRTATTTGSARFGDLASDARLRLECRPGTDGSVGWKLIVADPDAFGGFGFGDFEGPDAVAADQRLTELRLLGGLMQTRVTAEVGGWHGGTGDDGFVLAFAAPANATSDAALFADTIGPATREIVWRTASHADTARGIEARFDAREAAPAVRMAMMGCGPPPELGETQVKAWMGRNPAGVDLWNQRPVEWRLRGLLGRAHKDILARLSRAQPMGRVGDVAYVLAPDRENDHSGVAVMFVIDGETEVVTIDDGAIARHRSGTRQVKAPPAVREFIADRLVAAPAAADAADAAEATEPAEATEASEATEATDEAEPADGAESPDDAAEAPAEEPSGD